MADFVAVLRKTIDGLADQGPAMREKVYEKARTTVEAKLAALDPAPPASVADRQRQALEDAIREVEAAYTLPEPDPFAELEDFLAGSDRAAEQTAPVTVETPAADDPVSSVAHADPQDWRDLPGSSASGEFEAGRAAVTGDGEEGLAEEEVGLQEGLTRRRSFVPLIAAVIALVLAAGGAYAVWLNKDDFVAMLDMGGGTETTAADAQPADAPSQGEQEPAADAAATDDATPADEPDAPKFTQRLNSDGTETDEGRSGDIASFGEGTSVATVTQPPLPAAPEAEPATPAPDAPGDTAAPPAAAPAQTAATATESDAQVAVGQKAIFYEERTNVAEGSAEPGSVVWSLVQESPGNDLPPEPAIRGEASIPGKDVQLRMTIRRNADKTLPASHIIELIFLTPDGFEGGGIENILRFALKNTEEAAGSPVLGIPAKIADGFFLVALNDSKAEVETNMGLLGRERWIDVPLVYKSGRRALITMEKGVPGDKVFDEAIKAWQTATASAG